MSSEMGLSADCWVQLTGPGSDQDEEQDDLADDQYPVELGAGMYGLVLGIPGDQICVIEGTREQLRDFARRVTAAADCPDGTVMVMEPH